MDKKQDVVVKNKLRLILFSAYFVFIGLALSKVISYLYRIIIARYYGPEVYGLFSLAAMIAGFFGIISAMGLYEGLSRYIASYRAKEDISTIRYLLRFSLIFLTVSSLILGAILFFGADFISIQFFNNTQLAVFLKIFAIALPFGVLTGPFIASLRSYELIKEYSFVYNVSQNVIKLFALLFMIYLGVGSKSVPLSHLLGLFGMFVLSYYFCKKKIPQILINQNKINKNKSKVHIDLIKYSLPLFVAGMIFVIFFWIDSFFIGYFKTPLEVGVYNAATTIALLFLAVPELFMQLFFPLINKEYQKGNNKLIIELSKQIAKWIFIINLPIFILFFIFPGAALNIIFGAEYVIAESSLRILIVGTLIYSLSLVSYNLLSMLGKSKTIMIYTLIAAIINSVLNYILIPMEKIFSLDNQNGINGAAIATSISMLILAGLFIFHIISHFKEIPFRRKMINSVFAIFVPLVILLSLKSVMEINLISVISLSSLFLLTYFLMILLFRVFDRHDIELIKSSITKFKYKIVKKK